MTITIKLKTDNAAFQDGNLGREAARILRSLAEDLEYGAELGELRDINGNTVGTVKVTGR